MHDVLAEESLRYPDGNVPDRQRKHRKQLAAHLGVSDALDVFSRVFIQMTNVAVECDIPHVGRPNGKTAHIDENDRNKQNKCIADCAQGHNIPDGV